MKSILTTAISSPRRFLTLLALGLASAAAFAQPIAFTGNYTQNFDGMGAGLTLPTGWTCGPFGNPINLVVTAVSDGSSSALGTYNYGTIGTADRAVGSISGPTTGSQAYRVTLQNNTGQTLTQLQLRYDGEQWRVNGNAAIQSLTVQISVGSATNFTTLPAAFNFSSPVTTGTSALNGNLATNRVANIGGLVAVSIAPGEIFVVQWFDANDSGNDHGLAIDNVELTVPPMILVQPTNQTATVGATVSFSVTATGTTPLSYQWRRNGVHVPGAINATLTLVGVQLSDNGASFTVFISNVAGSVNSDPATLTVNPVGPSYRVDSVTPISLTTGDQVVITGAGFGNNPDNNCVVVGLPGGAVTLRVRPSRIPAWWRKSVPSRPAEAAGR